MPDAPVPRYNVLGVGIAALTLAETCRRVVGARGLPGARYICCATAHGLTEARRDPALRAIYNGAWLATPDGMPLVWLGPRGVERVYGPDLMLALCDVGRRVGLRHYFYGGVAGVVEELTARLTTRFPGLIVAGARTPPFHELNAQETATLHADIARAQPDVMWVGLGTPKQERFMARHAPALTGTVLIGVGAAFDFHSGRIRQAPRWMQHRGLEWLFRLLREPRRLGARYLITTPLFALRALAQKYGLQRYPIEPASR